MLERVVAQIVDMDTSEGVIQVTRPLVRVFCTNEQQLRVCCADIQAKLIRGSMRVLEVGQLVMEPTNDLVRFREYLYPKKNEKNTNQ